VRPVSRDQVIVILTIFSQESIQRTETGITAMIADLPKSAFANGRLLSGIDV
jgi:hypothetical protein